MQSMNTMVRNFIVSAFGYETVQLHPDLPLLIALHGGTCTHEYFAAPGPPAGSFIEIANRNGFSVLAFDRPGYGTSDPIPDEQNTFACQATILDDAISALTVDAGANGIVLIGHSIGGMVALEIAARRPAWKLIGVSVTGMGARIPAGGAAEATLYSAHSWTGQRLAVTAADITVPVHHALADFDALWDPIPEARRDFVTAFGANTPVESETVPGVGHCIEHHLLGASVVYKQLAFAHACWCRANSRIKA